MTRVAPKKLAVLTADALVEVDAGLREVVHYRKSGLSLNHIIGCPLDCAYCIRHSNDNFGMKQPQALLSDDEAVEALLSHPYFVAHTTPLQILNLDCSSGGLSAT
jgi:hypothetical protein